MDARFHYFLYVFSLFQIGVFSGLALAIGLYASFGNITRLFTSDPEVLMVVKSCALVNPPTLC
jgi:Na+-driven multidrug efflux pump